MIDEFKTSLPIEDLQLLITNCVNSCLQNNLRVNAREENNILNVGQVADFLHLSRPAIYGLVHAKKIPSFKQGKHLYFLKQDVVNWIKEGRKLTQRELNDLAEVHIAKLKGRA